MDDIKKLRGGIIFVMFVIIPYTNSGKIRRFLLRERVLAKYGDIIKDRVPSCIDNTNLIF